MPTPADALRAAVGNVVASRQAIADAAKAIADERAEAEKIAAQQPTTTTEEPEL